jgi:hypothetical protein
MAIESGGLLIDGRRGRMVVERRDLLPDAPAHYHLEMDIVNLSPKDVDPSVAVLDLENRWPGVVAAWFSVVFGKQEVGISVTDDGLVVLGTPQYAETVDVLGWADPSVRHRFAIDAERDSAARFYVDGTMIAERSWATLGISGSGVGAGVVRVHFGVTPGMLVRWYGVHYDTCVPPGIGTIYYSRDPGSDPVCLATILYQQNRSNDLVKMRPYEVLPSAYVRSVHADGRAVYRATRQESAMATVLVDGTEVVTRIPISTGAALVYNFVKPFDSVFVVAQSGLRGAETAIPQFVNEAGFWEPGAVGFGGTGVLFQNTFDGSSLGIRYTQPAIHLEDGIRGFSPTRWGGDVATVDITRSPHRAIVNTDSVSDAVVFSREGPEGTAGVSSGCWDFARAVRIERMRFEDDELADGVCEIDGDAVFDGGGVATDGTPLLLPIERVVALEAAGLCGTVP